MRTFLFIANTLSDDGSLGMLSHVRAHYLITIKRYCLFIRMKYK